ncbi:helix-turn-helix domain-containing protein [Streptomyces cyaneofuscatus]|uniref:helix-turn-helix domain-containing protein n=1 Tax=Streptomyces cyaneofuscatus TaxID=66883 RepID=UPI00382A5CAE
MRTVRNDEAPGRRVLDLDHRGARRSLPERLAFLRETRRRDDGERYTYDQLAERTHVSKALISALFSRARNPGVPVAGALEDFFGVEPRFLTLSGRRALEKKKARILTRMRGLLSG